VAGGTVEAGAWTGLRFGVQQVLADEQDRARPLVDALSLVAGAGCWSRWWRRGRTGCWRPVVVFPR
jgi:hypothetical protein